MLMPPPPGRRRSSRARNTLRTRALYCVVEGLRADDTDTAFDDLAPMPDLPAGLMSLEIFAAYVGPGIAAAAAEMPAGSSAIFARRGRWLVIKINSKERSTLTDLSTIRNRVLIDYRRNLADQTLRNYIEDLRQRASISVAKP